MDHAIYLECHHELSNKALISAHMMLGRGDAVGALGELEAVAVHQAALEDDGGDEPTPHLRYLAEHRTLATVAQQEATTLLQAGEPQLASVVVRDARAALDGLWSLRIAATRREVRP